MSIAQNFPTISPSLSLDFANVQALDPRITYTRASTATYYGTETALAEQNLFTYSQEFDNASWLRAGTTVTANTTTAPDGTTTADTIAFVDTAVSRVYQSFTGNGSAFTLSVFAEYIDKQWIALRLTDSGGTSRFAWFDVQNGVVGTTDTGITASIVASTEGFYRCIATISTTATINFAIIYGVNGDGSTSNVGQTGSVAVWGAQLEQRSAVTAYTVTTTQPITNYIPVLETAASGAARFDHNPTTFESLGLLVEEQRTNVSLRSEEFDNASWGTLNATVAANTIIAPDGTLTADTFIPDTLNATHFLRQLSLPSAAYTFSIYAKAGGETEFSMWLRSASVFGTFNLSNGTIVSQSASVTATITSVGNGWYRCSVYDATPGTTVAIYGRNGGSFAGNDYSGIYIWGAQAEAGAFPTSYIPTVASQVTRAADAASMTGTNFSSWFNNAEGTLYAEGVSASGGSGNQMIASIGDGAAAQNQVTMYKSGAALLQLITSSGATQSSLGSGLVATSNTNYKFSTAYKVNDFAFSVNANTVATDTSGQVPAVVNKLDIGNWHVNATGTWNSTIKKISYYPLRLSNTNLQALTG